MDFTVNLIKLGLLWIEFNLLALVIPQQILEENHLHTGILVKFWI